MDRADRVVHRCEHVSPRQGAIGEDVHLIPQQHAEVDTLSPAVSIDPTLAPEFADPPRRRAGR